MKNYKSIVQLLQQADSSVDVRMCTSTKEEQRNFESTSSNTLYLIEKTRQFNCLYQGCPLKEFRAYTAEIICSNLTASLENEMPLIIFENIINYFSSYRELGRFIQLESQFVGVSNSFSTHYAFTIYDQYL